jgi:hypothetical protein
MSTPTPLQAHTAYGLTIIEDHTTPVSDLNRFGYLPESRREAEDSDNPNEVASKAPIEAARKVTLDDLGGRSDALGG